MTDPPRVPDHPAHQGEGAGREGQRPAEGQAPDAPRLGAAGLWGVGGIVATFVQAIVKLTPVAIESFRVEGLGAVHWAFLAAWVPFCAYVEGYRAFQKQFCPRAVARALSLTERPSLLRVALAPAFCMGLFHATRRRLIVSWCVMFGVVGLVVAVRSLPQPWRGFIDAGVLIALAWGILCLGYFSARALGGKAPPVSPDLPER